MLEEGIEPMILLDIEEEVQDKSNDKSNETNYHITISLE